MQRTRKKGGEGDREGMEHDSKYNGWKFNKGKDNIEKNISETVLYYIQKNTGQPKHLCV